MKAIDLYSGIGGWALGLKAAGIEVVSSFEWWKPSVTTEHENLGLEVHSIDIRNLDFSLLPDEIDIVVGSPPCTQFSYANRGGSGDIQDGLKDIAKFLEVVDYLKPKFWAMENVPRVKSVLERELSKDGILSKFSHLRKNMVIEIVDCSDYGLPQRRKRCIAGVFPKELFRSYADFTQSTTLGAAIDPLENAGEIVDINFGIKIKKEELTEHNKEPFLDAEERRINKDAKTYHPVYNVMQFPDPKDKSVRTVTATCTRVSRESIVVRDTTMAEDYRRLTVRERAVLQGFPITYQFYGNSHSQKLKMIGNAIPPVLTYYIGLAMQEVPINRLVPLNKKGFIHSIPQKQIKTTKPDIAGRRYPLNRRFWFAIPNLLFKSGTRFDLVNDYLDDEISWGIKFFYGPSKDIREIKLDRTLLGSFQKINWINGDDWNPAKTLEEFQKHLDGLDLDSIQKNWTNENNKVITGLHPIVLLDYIGDIANGLISEFPSKWEDEAANFVIKTAKDQSFDHSVPGENKLRKNAKGIFCGLYLGSFFNEQVHGNA